MPAPGSSLRDCAPRNSLRSVVPQSIRASGTTPLVDAELLRRFLSTVTLVLAAASPALATTAADKATAREVATQGIELYRAGKYADALDRLKRAETLYDVPVHLLYIARCQDKLGQLVEASENYRLLDNYTLPENAPQPWVSAVADGRKELALLEPRLPKLRIVQSPANAADATLTIDGAPESSAVVGIARPINPGAHHVELSARGYDTAKADVTIAEGHSQDVNLTLNPAPTGVATTTPAMTSPAVAAAAPTSESRGGIGFLAGLRLGAAFPTGTLLNVDSTDLDTSKGFQPGAELELHGGLRFGLFTPVFYLSGASLGAGSGFGITGLSGKISDTTSGEIGLGIIVGTRPGRIGGFGEFDLGFNAFKLTHQGLDGVACDITASGGELRIGGGGIFPAFDFLNIAPTLMFSLGRFGTLSTSSNCPASIQSGSIASSDERTHGLVFLGVGGDFVFGKDVPKH